MIDAIARAKCPKASMKSDDDVLLYGRRLPAAGGAVGDDALGRALDLPHSASQSETSHLGYSARNTLRNHMWGTFCI